MTKTGHPVIDSVMQRHSGFTTQLSSTNLVLHYAVIIIIMYIYHALINALSAHMIHININMIFYAHVEHSPTKTLYIKYYKKQSKNKNALHTHTHTHTHTHAHTHNHSLVEWTSLK